MSSSSPENTGGAWRWFLKQKQAMTTNVANATMPSPKLKPNVRGKISGLSAIEHVLQQLNFWSVVMSVLKSLEQMIFDTWSTTWLHILFDVCNSITINVNRENLSLQGRDHLLSLNQGFLHLRKSWMQANPWIVSHYNTHYFCYIDIVKGHPSLLIKKCGYVSLSCNERRQ